MHPSRSAEIAATVADPAPVLQLIVVSAVEILQGAAGVIALLDQDHLVPRASYGLPRAPSPASIRAWIAPS